MTFKDYDELNEMQMSALCEIGNIGSGNAATALSTMLEKPVNISVPHVAILDYETITQRMGGAENLMIGMLLSVSGDITGMIMFLLEQKFAHFTINALLGGDLTEITEIGDMEMSAMSEIGNIMAASYINAMATMTDTFINISVPSLSIDMVGSMLSVPAIYYADISDKIIMVESNFNFNLDSAASHVLLIPEVESLKFIMQKLGIDE